VPADAVAGAADGDQVGFHVRLPVFEGPFDLLLGLIAKHKLDITEVALGEVTDEFIAYIKQAGEAWDLEQTTHFLVVAATLLDLKTARLLPSGDVEDEEDLALLEARDLLFARLLQYRAYKTVAAELSRIMTEAARSHPRVAVMDPQFAQLLPEVLIGVGAEGFALLASSALAPKVEPQISLGHVHAPIVSVKEQAALMVGRLRKARTASFRALVGDAPDTPTVVARFLALLELFKEGAVAFDQMQPLAELTVRWTGADEGDLEFDDEFDEEDAVQMAADEAVAGSSEEPETVNPITELSRQEDTRGE
jgi:segregation and condensation protein A